MLAFCLAMKITEVSTRVVNLDFRNAVLVTIATDEGITGIAETVLKRWTRSIEQAIGQIGGAIVGRDPTEIEDLWEKMYRDSFWVGGPVHATAISAIDCALWDILGRRCGLPVYKLHGGPTRSRVPVYCHCPAGASPEEFAARVRECVRRGYRALKTTLPVFYGVSGEAAAAYSGTNGMIARSWRETEYLPPDVIGRIRDFLVAAREAGGPELGIAVDCHGRLGFKAALQLARALEAVRPMFLEEPIPPENADLLALLRRESPVPVAAGERWATIYGVREFLEKEAVDVLQCDLCNCGGFTALKKIAAMAEAHYVGMAPHNPNGPLATVMNLHFAASIPNFMMLETVGSEADAHLWRELLGAAPALEDGALPLPDGPGFGVALNGEAVARRPYQPRPGWR
jgi:galactonate dehydratase